MKQNMNYINALPDFLAMQRVSFCWFIAQGLNEELALFSKIYDFSQNTEYIMFGEEYSLIKPAYSLLIARKYSGNYRAQLVIPIEVRNKINNSVQYQNQFPIITLPLMTTYATFIINGCERVIVSQIIRSPGIYFEKNKNQKNQQQFKRKLSTDINKLRVFLPSGEAFISELDLFFAVPHISYDKIKRRKKMIPTWNNNSIYYYSINYLKNNNQNATFYFLQCFKLYRLICNSLEIKSNLKLIQVFLKWVKLKNNYRNFKSDLKNNKVKYILQYFQFLSKLLFRYQILNQTYFPITKINSNNLNFFSIFKENTNLSNIQIEKLLQLYNKTIINCQISAQLQLNSNLVLITNQTKNWLSEMNNFQFLKQNLNSTLLTINNINKIIEFPNLRPTIYFSVSLKEQLKYIFGKDKFFSKPERHKYLKTKTQLLLYKKDHEIKTDYHKKYNEKDLYTATLIPEYGSWIRFSFQKNTNINPYKYPIKNQEDEVIIQLDKTNQKPILSLLKEMGLTDLEIYKNLVFRLFLF